MLFDLNSRKSELTTEVAIESTNLRVNSQRLVSIVADLADLADNNPPAKLLTFGPTASLSFTPQWPFAPLVAPLESGSRCPPIRCSFSPGPAYKGCTKSGYIPRRERRGTGGPIVDISGDILTTLREDSRNT
ncbi:hypothetical protein MBM_09179 [Drepanopeziza brunnea f. sp. 'multigermtubi' MB_m1]|uniref:Uncharacterized protein n=1 Tax=Marssonina brunnea f. sp. multigermtubi (strain MB_m1) TaxID=1072389 RepID=K1W6K5_MARBU|nr:uncharacterized protein MBM_09179 [Drepanopeziza brunnea f. sp. 'multigermtubi' MB_m1]EKD12610.1 hypothetical protein MBM_09179 [Drepanopeziza brunnea f. sp. 'multigermtubi' MB_m1]